MDAPKAVVGPFEVKFHQVAIYTNDVERSVEAYRQLGYTGWSFDSADLVGTLNGTPVRTRAYMAFNYEIMPLELEFLQYYGPSRHSRRAALDDTPFISHMSVHVGSIEEYKHHWLERFGMSPFHEFETHNHSNEAVKGKKRFKEAIYDFRDLLGFDIKLIERIPW